MTIKSDIDDTIATAILVDAASISGATFPFGEKIPVEIGRKKFYHVLPTFEDKPICQALADLEITNDTPDNCAIRQIDQPKDGEDEAGENEVGWLEIEGLVVGDCLFTANYTAGNAGAGTSSQLTLTVVP